MINVLELLRNLGVNPRRASGDEFHSHCPKCGSGGKSSELSDRFQVYPSRNDGRGWFICRRCGIRGDNIQFLIEFQNMSYIEACRELGIEPKSKKEDGSRRLPKTPSLPPQHNREKFDPQERRSPVDTWCVAATEFVEWAHEQLKLCKVAMDWLAERGINMETVERYRLGWNPGKDGKPLYRPRKKWGLEEEKDKKTGRKKTLWLPIGWVVPLLDYERTVVQIRIRRLDSEIKKFLPDMKYRVIPGSSMATMVLKRDARAFVVVENGLDACLVAQETDSIVGAVTTWNAQAKPDRNSTELLHKATAIMLAHDFDDAGRKGAAWWLKNFDNARRWPVPVGNDVGEAWAAGVDINDWILEGLPPVLTIQPGDVLVNSPGQGNSGEEAKEFSKQGVPVSENREIVDTTIGLPCGGCGCRNYTFAPNGYVFDDGQDPCDGWKCDGCGSVFLLSGNKEADAPFEEEGGLEQDPELLGFLDGLRKHRGYIHVRDKGQSMGIRFAGPPNSVDVKETRQLSQILYTGTTVPFLTSLLADGKYTANDLARFAGIGG